MNNNQFAHLHLHTEYSLLDGATKISELAKKLKNIGQTAVAITEHGNMYSLVRANIECKNVGIKHIIGCEFYVAPTSRFDKVTKKGEARYNHLIVLAKDLIGYKQLIRMCSLGYLEGFYYRPRIDEELLFSMEPGHLIVTTACIGSSFAQDIVNGCLNEAEASITKYAMHFGKDFYLEVQNHGIELETIVTNNYINISNKLGIPIIAAQDSHYLNKEDCVAHDVALCIGTGQNFVEERKFKFEGTNYHVMTVEEMLPLYREEWLTNTMDIVNKCDDGILEYGNIRLPKFVPPEPGTDPEYDRWLIANNT